jgi:pyruvate dehydrogenase E2 component (dihydrolipoamide acetyltransferase)
MPKLGLTMTEATLTRWYKAAGDSVRRDEVIFEFESEKSVMEYECPVEGVLTELLVVEGQTVPCGTTVATLQAIGSTPVVAASPPSTQPAAITATPAAKRLARERGLDLTGMAGSGPEGRVQLADVEAAAHRTVTPAAERMATELGLDWTQVAGSGSGGRVHKADVEAAAPAPVMPSTPPPPLVGGPRAVIARRMSESAFTAPHVTLFSEAEATALVEARRQLNAELTGAAKISYNALLMAMVARLLPEHPALNAGLIEGEIRLYDDINIALAVDTERGLLAPVVRHVDRLGLLAIQQTGDALIKRAIAGQSRPDDLTGGTFTLTNLGMYEIDGFTPIINQPQAAILGVGRIAPKAVVAPAGEIVARQMLTLSLSFDHRMVDGAPAARFLQRVKQLIERPMALLLRG